MAAQSQLVYGSPPSNLCEMFLRDIAMILVTSQLIKRSLGALRPQCEFSHELTKTIDNLSSLCEGGEPSLSESLLEAGVVLPVWPAGNASAVIKGFISNIPLSVAPAVLAAEVISSLRLLVQHFELKIVLVAEAALLVGQTHLNRTLVKWSAEWRTCGRILRSLTVRVRANAYVADLEGEIASQFT